MWFWESHCRLFACGFFFPLGMIFGIIYPCADNLLMMVSFSKTTEFDPFYQLIDTHPSYIHLNLCKRDYPLAASSKN